MKIVTLRLRLGTALLTMALLAGLLFTGAMALPALTQLGGSDFEIPRALDRSQSVELVVLMYHSVNSKEGRAGDFVITPAALRQDLEYLKQQGYTGITVSELIAFVHEGAPLPPKPIMLTFDDGYYNNYLHAFPLLKEYGQKAVISIIGAETDKYSQLEENNQNYSHLTWEQIKEMQQSGLVEFQNHSYNLHKLSDVRKGCMKSGCETTQQYQQMLEEDIDHLQQRYTEMTGWTPNAFTYPFGRISKESYPVITQLGFAASLDVQARKLIATPGDERCLYRIPRFNRTNETSAQRILEKALG